MSAASKNVMLLAIITGQLPVTHPNSNQANDPNVKMAYMLNEMLDVFFVLMICTACGKNENVVQKAAM